MSYLEQIDKNRVPKHVAVIMDGNGRWAQAQGMPRSFGHAAGVDTVKKVTAEAVRLGVKYLTLYTFSTENWNRPAEEVALLMQLLIDKLEDELFFKNHVRLRVIGDMDRLPQAVQDTINGLMERTKDFDVMTVTIAISYSSRWEITEMTKHIVRDANEGRLKPEDVTEQLLSSRLQASFMPDPDLLIRTGGEFRISNYLLWQCAYSEFYFCDTYWPDFNEEGLQKAIVEYQQRQRRFGKTGAQVEEEKK